MTTPTSTVALREARTGLARLVVQHRIREMPVVEDGGRVVGVVSDGDCSSGAGRRRTATRGPGGKLTTIGTALPGVDDLVTELRKQ
jgi:CBS-domain-containing membrane protein